MLLKGTYKIDDKTYGVLAEHTNIKTEVLLVSNGTVISAFKTDETGSYSFINKLAKDIVQNINKGYKGCTSKNGVPMPFELGAMTQHEFTKTKIRYIVQLYKKQVCGIFADTDNMKLELVYDEAVKIPAIPYIKLTTVKKDIELSEDELDTIQTRSISEIALEKEDLTWLQKKKYFIVNDDDTAEKLFSFIDGYNGPVAYDTETTGLKINCFGQINSTYKKSLDKYNKEHPNDRIRADKLVGIIFCVEENTSYYFPCANRKFKNLYESGELREKLIDKYKARYIIGEGKDSDKPIAGYWRDTDRKDITSDVILMERVRHILETRHILAHNGSFEYKVGMQYCIDTNLKDDTMILHQVAYKYRNGAMKEPSNLKHLAKVELGMDQWELKDFFPNWKPDKEGLVRKKPGSKISLANQIDFSYMDYDGTRIYAPADGDATLGLFKVFKTDLVKNKPEQEYIYNVEVLVACAVGYMEFYGHRIDESKILEARARTMLSKSMLVSQIRQSIDYSNENEIKAYNNAKDFIDKEKEINLDEDNRNNKLIELNKDIEDAIQANTEKQINLGSPAQVMDLFYNKLGMPVIGDKPSVAKKVVKALTKEKNIDGTAKYPVAMLYSKYKNEETLLSKFFDNLIYFMYPGGFIFSSFGQVATDTGRMSCRQPNSQQYPKHITKIIIPRQDCVMVDADYSQIEYRVLTALAKNTELAKLFSDPDSDYHTLMAALMYNVEYSAVTPAMRSAAKSFNFGIPYGMGLGSLAILLTGRNTKQTRDEAAEKMEDYYRNQPRTRKFFDNVKEMAQVNGYTTTLFKRVRKYDFTDKDGKVNNAKRAASLRQAGNAVIQGCISGNTLIKTKKYGIVRIQDVVGERLEVWNGHKWTLGDIEYSGKKQLCKVKFYGEHEEFICSPIHKFKVGDNFVKCEDLKKGYEIIGDTKNEKVMCVEITDRYIDMYDVCNTEDGYYVADGLITHNTAADIFKIGVARNFSFIRRNDLFGKMMIINMIHDEQLIEVNVKQLNIKRVLAEIGINMQFKIDGFPPLFIGAGVAGAWGKAKSKDCEIHPLLLDKITEEAKNLPLYNENGKEDTPEEVIKAFERLVYTFRENKVYDYVVNEENWCKVLHPAIAGLINLQFNYGRGDSAEGYVGPNGERYTDHEFLMLNLAEFLERHGLSDKIKPSFFEANINQTVDEDEDDYDDEDDEDVDDIDETMYEADKQFTLIDESDKQFGASIHDLINTFGVCMSKQNNICGINMKDMYYKKRDTLIDYISKFVVDKEDNGAMQVVFLNDSNVLKYTGIYVKGIDYDELEFVYKHSKPRDVSYAEADVENRSQAK